MRSLRIVCYAVNGSGVGHLMRLVAVSRWLRRYARHARHRAEIYFLTSSEADGLLFHERFASFKLPSKTVVDDAGIDKLAYLALAKQWVWHSLGLLRPDLLVVDSFPRGSFGELLSALDLARRRAFIYRPVKDDFAARADFQAMLPLYDAILVPERAADAPVRVPAAAAGRVRHLGPVLARERSELAPRAEARARLGVPDGRLAVYVSAGGGGDALAERHLHDAASALSGDPGLHLVAGAGPLYRGRPVTGERVTWLGGELAFPLMAGFDLAVCAAGYNTWNELMHAGVPSIFLPQDKVADDQAARADRAVAAGAGLRLGSMAELPAAVAGWRDEGRRASAAAAAAALVPRNHARDLAAELLRLVLPAATVAAAEEAIDDTLLAAARELDLDLEIFLELIDALDGETTASPVAVARRAIALVRHATTEGIPVSAVQRVTALLARRLPAARPDDRADAAARVLLALRPFDDWGGALSFLKVFTPEPKLPAAQLGDAICDFLAGVRARGEDLYRGIAQLSSGPAVQARRPS